MRKLRKILSDCFINCSCILTGFLAIVVHLTVFRLRIPKFCSIPLDFTVFQDSTLYPLWLPGSPLDSPKDVSDSSPRQPQRCPRQSSQVTLERSQIVPLGSPNKVLGIWFMSLVRDYKLVVELDDQFFKKNCYNSSLVRLIRTYDFKLVYPQSTDEL